MSIIEAPLKLLGKHAVDCIIIGGVAAALHGSTMLTNDLDVCHSRSRANLDRLAGALRSVNAHLRNAPDGLPFILDGETLHKGLNFMLSTDVGSLDLLGEVRGIGYFEDVIGGAVMFELFGYRFPVLDLAKLIIAKRTAGRPKDLVAIPELEAILQRQAMSNRDG